jgi:anti-sigma factor RsiW
MTACARWREELIDHALGQAASAALSAHLATCAGCAAALAACHAGMGRLDAGVRALVAREPSSSVRSRVLAGIDSGPLPWTLAWRMRTAIVGAVLIASIVLVAYGIALKNERAQSTAIASAGAALSHWRAPTDVLLHDKRY